MERTPSTCRSWTAPTTPSCPPGYASFRHPDLDPSNVDEFNAEIADIAAWYAPRWQDLAWEVDADGTATKQFDGVALQASIDLGKGPGYAIVVSQADGDYCG